MQLFPTSKGCKRQKYSSADLTCVLESLKDLQLDGTADCCWLLLVGRGKLIQELLVIFLQGRGKTGCCWMKYPANLRQNFVKGGVNFIERCQPCIFTVGQITTGTWSWRVLWGGLDQPNGNTGTFDGERNVTTSFTLLLFSWSPLK